MRPSPSYTARRLLEQGKISDTHHTVNFPTSQPWTAAC